MNKKQLQNLAKMRTEEAKVLLRANQYAGAYYIVGYAVECALKACIAKQVKRHDFPDKKLANDSYTHDLIALFKLSGLHPNFVAACHANPSLDVNWAIVKDWSEAKRYEDRITAADARDIISACIGRNGVLPWIKKKW
jgi:hypothetical protein